VRLMKPLYRWTMTAAGTVVCFYAARAVPLVANQTIQPFYLERTVAMSAETGSEVAPAKHLFVARRTDGVTVTAETVGPLQDNLWVRNVLSPMGTNVFVYDSVKMKTTMPVRTNGPSAALARRLAHVSSTCTPQEPESMVGPARVLGVDVVVTTMTRPTNTLTISRAPSLGCEELHYQNKRPLPDGTLAVVYEQTTTKLVMGSPDPALFAVPDEYSEVKPSVALNALVQRMSVVLSLEDQQKVRREGQDDDNMYLKRGATPEPSRRP
jgi:hypothetical protein